MKRKIISASFSNGIGRVTFEDGTIEQMTHDEYIIIERNYQYSSIAQLARFLEKRGQFYYAGHTRPLYTVTVFSDMKIADLTSFAPVTKDEYKKLARLLKRYVRFYNYCKETAPQWREIDRINWADNSIDSVQINKHGEKRHVQITGPHGDACY